MAMSRLRRRMIELTRVVPQGRAACVAVHGKPLPPRRSMTAVRLAVAAAESAVASTARHRDVQPTTVTRTHRACQRAVTRGG